MLLEVESSSHTQLSGSRFAISLSLMAVPLSSKSAAIGTLEEGAAEPNGPPGRRSSLGRTSQEYVETAAAGNW